MSEFSRRTSSTSIDALELISSELFQDAVKNAQHCLAEYPKEEHAERLNDIESELFPTDIYERPVNFTGLARQYDHPRTPAVLTSLAEAYFNGVSSRMIDDEPRLVIRLAEGESRSTSTTFDIEPTRANIAQLEFLDSNQRESIGKFIERISYLGYRIQVAMRNDDFLSLPARKQLDVLLDTTGAIYKECEQIGLHDEQVVAIDCDLYYRVPHSDIAAIERWDDYRVDVIDGSDPSILPTGTLIDIAIPDIPDAVVENNQALIQIDELVVSQGMPFMTLKDTSEDHFILIPINRIEHILWV